MLSFLILRAVLMAGVAVGLNIQATNDTYDGADGSGIDLALPVGNTIEVFSTLYPLTSGASDLPTYGISDNLFYATGNNQQDLTRSQVAYMSCDSSDYPGYYSLVDVFQTALSVNCTGIILFSLKATQCNLTGLDSDFQYVYSMPNQTVAQTLLDRINNDSTLSATVLHSDSSRISNNGSSTSGSSQSTHQTYGSSPTTAVAMIILYSVTGVITALFLIIIITGAVRAHRHPERYGPRSVTGRPRQSRARGMARAMLDTIPIVKFGEQHPQDPKQIDLEMTEHADPASRTAEQSEISQATRNDGTAPRQSTTSVRSGIGAAANGADGPTEGAPATQADDALGCSICTDDFVAGQDLRVLPCNHQFHPECIDPWLLNVSGTCPLCRIDLRPQASQESHSEETPSEDGELPPPIAGSTGPYRISMRRSLLIGLGLDRGIGRENRMAAARELRDQQTEGRDGQVVDESRRRRLRERFGIRTRTQDQTTSNPSTETPAVDATIAEERSADADAEHHT